MDYQEYTAQNNEQINPCRVEIKENSKGEPAVSVRATGDATKEDADKAMKFALYMYRETRKEL